MKEVLSRILADTPKFFKRLRVFGASLGAAGLAIVSIPGIPDALNGIAAQMVWIGGVIVAVASCAVTDPDNLKK